MTSRLSSQRSPRLARRPAMLGMTHATALFLVALLLPAESALATSEALRQDATGGVSFEERVACQRAIEHVYWNHRLWPKGNVGPRPSFETSIPEAFIRRQAEDALLESQALEEWWGRSITAEMLQAELDRIVASTQRPTILREVFAALDHDPDRIAECLARPALAARLLREWYAGDERLHAATRTGAQDELDRFATLEALRRGAGRYEEIEFNGHGRSGANPFGDVAAEGAPQLQAALDWLDGVFGVTPTFAGSAGELKQPVGPPTGDSSFGIAVGRHDAAWPSVARTPLESLPVGTLSALQEASDRFYVVAVLEASAESLRIGRVEWRKRPQEEWWNAVRVSLASPDPLPASGYRLEKLPEAACIADTWRPTAVPMAELYWGTAVWTGSEMLVWGGGPFPQDFANYGGRYDPATDTWKPIGTWNAPENRLRHTAVWTGSEMIVWGGEGEGLDQTATGGRYNPATNTWSSTALAGAPTARYYHTAVWTGSEMVVWGGCTDALCNVLAATGGRYDPSSDGWTSVATGSAPAGRYGHAAAWTGSEMLVWGGWTGSQSESTGGRYDPVADSWQATSTAGAPDGRFFHSAVWADDRMIVWGGNEGEFSTVFFNTGGRYDPVGDQWFPTATGGAPSGRDGHRAVWTGSEMILFGGFDGANEVATGGRYDPLADNWSPTSTVNAPSPRTIPNLVWTGSEVVVWSGIGSPGAEGDGARYDPATNSWVPVGRPATPSERTFHSHAWTGVEAVVWGGCGIFAADPCPTDTGGLYDLVTDSWTPTSVAGAPTRREFQNTVWTGSEMLIWGGCGDVFCASRFDTGGRFDPATNSWAPMSAVGAPVRRYWHDGVWTGSEMIVWGGCGNKDCTNTNPPLPRDGGRYDPATDSWTPTNEVDAPGGRWFTTTTWTGDEMIVWGGQDMDVGRLNDGGRYDPTTDSWAPTATSGAPIPRVRHRAHWTGDRLLVWGGDDFFGQFYNSGGLYDPATDSWAATATAGAPSPRAYPYTAWTGQELVVWGGLPIDDGGGLYDPSSDGWRPMTQVEAPTVRADLFTGAWTGSELFLFGGTYPENLMESETGGVYCVSPVSGSEIFADGFESGDTSAWTLAVP